MSEIINEITDDTYADKTLHKIFYEVLALKELRKLRILRL